MIPVFAAGAAMLAGGTTVGATAGAIAAGAAAVAGGIAAQKALSGGDEKDQKDDSETQVRYVSEDYVKKQIAKGTMSKS